MTAITVLKRMDNTSTNDAIERVVVANVIDAYTYTVPEGTNFGTAIVTSIKRQSTGTAIDASVSAGVITFIGAGVSTAAVTAFKYTFQK